mmetsp:Transcript_71939/g.203148  ORF Transcript_71939/g.203148 Transcript_71939/m.203148 type:complete len:292 (-) Transcript_71939:758-1633(-)
MRRSAPHFTHALPGVLLQLREGGTGDRVPARERLAPLHDGPERRRDGVAEALPPIPAAQANGCRDGRDRCDVREGSTEARPAWWQLQRGDAGLQRGVVRGASLCHQCIEAVPKGAHSARRRGGAPPRRQLLPEHGPLAGQWACVRPPPARQDCQQGGRARAAGRRTRGRCALQRLELARGLERVEAAARQVQLPRVGAGQGPVEPGVIAVRRAEQRPHEAEPLGLAGAAQRVGDAPAECLLGHRPRQLRKLNLAPGVRQEARPRDGVEVGAARAGGWVFHEVRGLRQDGVQ